MEPQRKGAEAKWGSLSEMNWWAGNSDQWVECLPSTHGALGSVPRTYKPGMVTHDCNPSTGKWKQEDQMLKVTLNSTVS